MSNKMMTLTWESALSKAETSILVAIADHANDDGEGCWAGIDRIVYKTKYERRHVIRIIMELEAKGILVRNGKHPKYGTNVWSIIKNKIPAQPPFDDWKKLQMAKYKKEAQNEPYDTMPYAKEEPYDIAPHMESKSYDTMPYDDMAQCHPIPITTPYKELHHSIPEISQNGSADAKVSPANAGRVGLVADDDPWNEAAVPAKAVQKDYLSENKDHEYSRGDDEDDPKAAHRARTPLEQKIAQLTNSKYLTDAQRSKLSSPVMASYGKQLPQEYGSPENEWRENPVLFSEYVTLCAKLISNGSGRQPSRTALITTMRNYARNKSGWLFFKDFKEEAAAPAKQVQKQYYHNPATPSWRA
jgi:hypothetical protein